MPTQAAITGTPTAVGTYNISIRARNISGVGTSRNVTIVIVPADTVDPSVTSLSVITNGGTVLEASLLVAYKFQLEASEKPLEFLATGLPPGLVIAPQTGIISGTPRVIGTYLPKVRARNVLGLGPETTLSLNVVDNPASSPLSRITVPTPVYANYGENFLLNITATNDPVAIKILENPKAPLDTQMPSGLFFDPTTNQIRGKPTIPGVYHVEMLAYNAKGPGPASIIEFIVLDFQSRYLPSRDVVAAAKPTIISSLEVSTTVNAEFAYQIRTANNDALTYTAVTSADFASPGQLPRGLYFDAYKGLLFGTPKASGLVVIHISAANEQGVTTETLILTVAAADGSVSPTTLPTPAVEETSIITEVPQYTVDSSGQLVATMKPVDIVFANPTEATVTADGSGTPAGQVTPIAGEEVAPVDPDARYPKSSGIGEKLRTARRQSNILY